MEAGWLWTGGLDNARLNLSESESNLRFYS
jgi:hypothetical protein